MKKIETVEEYNEMVRTYIFSDNLEIKCEAQDLINEASPLFYFDQQGNAIALRSDLIRKPTGEEIVNSVIRACAIDNVEHVEGTDDKIIIWSSNANEQIEAALEEIMSKDSTGGVSND